MPKQWKATPPGPEQLLLEAMFEEGAIDDFETPAAVQMKNSLFHGFSDKVFENHFRKTKGKFGGYANIPPIKENAGEIFAGLGPIGPVATSSQTRKRPLTSTEHKPVSECDIQFKNAPHVTWVYTDHTKKCEIVCVAISVISGARKVNFFLSEDNVTLNVTYIWPSAIYSAEELFHSKLNANANEAWTMNHPKINSFMSRLVECGLTARSLPEASIIIKLPTKVQREAHTCKRSGVKTADELIVMLEFEAFQKQQILEDEDTSIVFE